MANKKTPVVIVAQTIKELEARLSEAQADHAAAVARHQDLKVTAQRISDTLSDGSGDWSEDELIESRQRLEAAAAISEAKRRGIARLGAQLNQAKAVHIAEGIKAQAHGYVRWEQLSADIQAATAEFVGQLDAIADKAEERNAYLFQAAEQLRQIDGGERSMDGEEIAGIRRVYYGGEQTIQMDGERLLTMPATAVFETAIDVITTAAVPSAHYARQLERAAA